MDGSVVMTLTVMQAIGFMRAAHPVVLFECITQIYRPGGEI